MSSEQNTANNFNWLIVSSNVIGKQQQQQLQISKSWVQIPLHKTNFPMKEFLGNANHLASKECRINAADVKCVLVCRGL